MSNVRVKVHECTGTIVLDRPNRCNCFNLAMVSDVRQALSDLYQERRVRAVIITGAGKYFCTGTDLESLHERAQSDDSAAHWHQEVLEHRELIADILRFPKPVITAVNGPAAGLGAALVLAADLAIATSNASFSAPETLRGLAPGLVAPLLVFRFGAAVAARLCLTGMIWTAEQAHEYGIFQELVDFDLVWARAHDLGKQCAQSSREALSLTKRLINETVGEPLATWLALGAAASATARTTDSAREGITAFMEKRLPQW